VAASDLLVVPGRLHGSSPHDLRTSPPSGPAVARPNSQRDFRDRN
jgi:hypothetical protein